MMRRAGHPRALIRSWLDFQPASVQALADQLRVLVRQAEPALAEGVRWGKLVFALDGMPVLALAPVKGHANLQLLQGAPWPAALEAAAGARQLRLLADQTIDPVAVEMLVSAGCRHVRQLLAERPPRPGDDEPA